MRKERGKIFSESIKIDALYGHAKANNIDLYNITDCTTFQEDTTYHSDNVIISTNKSCI